MVGWVHSSNGGIRLTAREFEWLAEDGPYRSELVQGRVVREPLAGAEHGRIGVLITIRLHRFVEAGGWGVVFGAETGFILSTDPATVRAPDVAFIARDRVPPGGLPRGFFPGAPDFAVEIAAPASTSVELREKVCDYLAAGTRLVWVVEPRSRTVAVHRPDGGVRVVEEGDEVDGGDLLPGLRVPVAELFAS